MTEFLGSSQHLALIYTPFFSLYCKSSAISSASFKKDTNNLKSCLSAFGLSLRKSQIVR
ncbi:helix-turn-helix domain-containing protein [Polaribacter sp.]|uniref:helix-turn-helix domain-containing protein n=1 Tax=Polaribacter sp. TaxID=1920175 RepID=UPI004047FC7A